MQVLLHAQYVVDTGGKKQALGSIEDKLHAMRASRSTSCYFPNVTLEILSPVCFTGHIPAMLQVTAVTSSSRCDMERNL